MATEKRLIDANALKDVFCSACSTNKRYQRTNDDCRRHRDSYGNGCFKMRLIDETPTVDAVEVVHGCWKKDEPDKYGNRKPKCCVCGKYHLAWWSDYTHCNYCPNCGAKMDGDGNG